MATKITAVQLYDALKNDFGFVNAQGEIKFNLKNFTIIVEQNNVVGNILEEWLAKWMKSKDYDFIHNPKQSSPDIWLDPNNLESEWLEIKSFTGSPNFDIGNFRGYINEIIDKPYKLNAKYLLIKYKMESGGQVEIENFWLKNVWQISSPMSTWPVKVQYRNRAINNLRPSVWYSNNVDYPSFKSLEHYLAALEQTIYKYHDTNSIADTWLDKLLASYKKHYGVQLNVPRWNDIKSQYGL